MANLVKLSRDEAEGLTDAVIFFLENAPPEAIAKYFASNGALKIAKTFGMSEEYQEKLIGE